MTRRSLAAFLCLFIAMVPLAAEGTFIKFATLAPEGSTWMKVMEEWNREVSEKSGGRLKFRIYSGGISGDEKDVIRKIRFGQLQAGGFTGVGLGEIAPTVRLLDAPFLFRNTSEVDFILKTYEEEWERAFRAKGYVLLGWAEVGPVYFFTSPPIQNLFDLKGVKMWIWEGDPIAEAAFQALGVHPIPLSITDVLTSLQTGLVNGVYGSPLALVALQWFTRVKYRYDTPLAHAQGAVLIAKPFFDKLPADLQTLLRETGRRHLRTLTELSRKENLSALDTLKKNGVRTLGPPTAAEAAQYESAGEKARRLLAGKLYSAELLDKVEKSLKDYRKQ